MEPKRLAAGLGSVSKTTNSMRRDDEALDLVDVETLADPVARSASGVGREPGPRAPRAPRPRWDPRRGRAPPARACANASSASSPRRRTSISAARAQIAVARLEQGDGRPGPRFRCGGCAGRARRRTAPAPRKPRTSPSAKPALGTDDHGGARDGRPAGSRSASEARSFSQRQSKSPASPSRRASPRAVRRRHLGDHGTAALLGGFLRDPPPPRRGAASAGLGATTVRSVSSGTMRARPARSPCG